jgi:predicted  nucleic acid-binding Zn-ribbon protein
MWDQTLQKRLQAFQDSMKHLQARIVALQATNRSLVDDAKKQQEEAATAMQRFTEEKSKITQNYKQLYAKLQEIRSRSREV